MATKGAAKVIDIIANPKCALKVLGQDTTSLEIGPESGCWRPLEHLQQLVLARGEFQRPRDSQGCFQRCPPASLKLMLPAALTARIDIQKAHDLGMSQPLFPEFDATLMFALQLYRTTMWSDRSRQLRPATIPTLTITAA